MDGEQQNCIVVEGRGWRGGGGEGGGGMEAAVDRERRPEGSMMERRHV